MFELKQFIDNKVNEQALQLTREVISLKVKTVHLRADLREPKKILALNPKLESSVLIVKTCNLEDYEPIKIYSSQSFCNILGLNLSSYNSPGVSSQNFALASLSLSHVLLFCYTDKQVFVLCSFSSFNVNGWSVLSVGISIVNMY